MQSQTAKIKVLVKEIRPFIPLFHSFYQLQPLNGVSDSEIENGKFIGLYPKSFGEINDRLDEIGPFLNDVEQSSSYREFDTDLRLLKEVKDVCFQLGEQIRTLETWDPSVYGLPGSDSWYWFNRSDFKRVRRHLISIDLWRPWGQVMDRRHESRMTV